MTTRWWIAFLPWLACCSSLWAGDWPQWRGPDRNGISSETGLLKTWPPDGPKLVWSIKTLGLGYSSPAIFGNRLYILGTRESSEFAFALDAQTGKEIWAAEIGPIFQWKGNIWGDGPRSTPTVDGDHVYALGAQGELLCLEAVTGKKVWAHNLFKEFNGFIMDNNGKERVGWGYCEGPLIDGELVVCTPGGDDGLLIAFNKKNGHVVWRSTEVKSKAPYSSLIATEAGGLRHYIQLTEKGVVGIAAKDGRLLWQYSRPNDDLVVRTPVVRNDYVFTTYSYGSGSELFQILPGVNGSKTEKIYSSKNMKNEMGGVVWVSDHIYGYSDRQGLVCQESMKKKGEIVWSEKGKVAKGSIIYGDGNLYCYSEEDGTVVLVEASPVKFKQNGRFKIPQESSQRVPAGKIWSHPVIAHGHLYLRDQELLFRYLVRPE